MALPHRCPEPGKVNPTLVPAFALTEGRKVPGQHRWLSRFSGVADRVLS